MAFYKRNGEELLKAEEFVYSPLVSLSYLDKDTYTYPQDGWYWFDTLDEAMQHFSSSSLIISPRQMRLILLQYNLLDTVEALVLSDRTLQIWWEYSIEIERDNQILNDLGTAINLTPDQIDQMFNEASKL